METKTRREVLKTAAITAAATFAAPALLRGQNLNNKIRVAIVGMGGRSREHAESLIELEQTGKILIPCFQAREQDNWEDHTFAVQKYIRFDPAQHGWR